eukprot:scaffold236690_cov20-Prasinocladus_malaysianus.AAC.1
MSRYVDTIMLMAKPAVYQKHCREPALLYLYIPLKTASFMPPGAELINGSQNELNWMPELCIHKLRV